jgi:hypothetical protein
MQSLCSSVRQCAAIDLRKIKIVAKLTEIQRKLNVNDLSNLIHSDKVQL